MYSTTWLILISMCLDIHAVCYIRKWCTSKSCREAQLKSAEWAASFKNGSSKQDAVSNVSRKVVLCETSSSSCTNNDTWKPRNKVAYKKGTAKVSNSVVTDGWKSVEKSELDWGMYRLFTKLCSKILVRSVGRRYSVGGVDDGASWRSGP